ncbi:MAG: metallophosphoesterase family protein [Armatimonadota bacterium]
MRIGVISDTHGRVPKGVHEAFQGVSLILHAGDVGGEDVIAELETIARVVAVRGNVDADLPASQYPLTRRLTLEGADIFLCHEPFRAVNVTPIPDIIIHGHTHVPKNSREGRTLWLNPGTAGKPQFGQTERTVAILTVGEGEPAAEIISVE